MATDPRNPHVTEVRGARPAVENYIKCLRDLIKVHTVCSPLISMSRHSTGAFRICLLELGGEGPTGVASYDFSAFFNNFFYQSFL